MTKKPAAEPGDAAAVPKQRQKEYTAEPTQGGSYDEDGKLVQRTEPEPDQHRLTKPER